MRIGTFAVLAVLALAAPAAGQPATTAKADALFNEGRTLLEAGRFKEACEKFEASLDESDALGTRLNLALCMEKRGWIYSAVVKYDDTAARAERAGQHDSAKVARDHANALRSLVPELVITLTAPVVGERVMISRPGHPDREIDPRNPVPIDPTDPNDPTDRITVTARAEGHVAYAAPPVTILPSGPALPKPAPIVIPELAAILDPSIRPVPPVRHRRRLYGVLLAGGGAVAIAGSALWAVKASDNSASCRDDLGNLDTGCGDFLQLRFGATGLFVAGAAAVGLGVYLILTPHKGEERTALIPTAGPDRAGLAVLGHF